jgi:hypothetical protein
VRRSSVITNANIDCPGALADRAAGLFRAGMPRAHWDAELAQITNLIHEPEAARRAD